MPIPKPKDGEQEQEFISRCISELYNEYGQEQSAGICYSQWRDKDQMSEEVFADYPWDECVSDQLDKGYSEESANKICGFIRWSNMNADEFKTLPTSDCIEKAKSAGYNDEDAKLACSGAKKVSEDAQQGGVAFARVKFEYPPKVKEKMNDFMARCMADEVVREKKPNRSIRGGFCYSEYQSRYIGSIGKSWK